VVIRSKAENVAIKLVAYYNFNGEMDDGTIHPRIQDLIDYMVKNITDEQAGIFYDKIINNCQWFPARKELSDIYNALNSVTDYRIGPDKQLTEGAAAAAFCKNNDGIMFESPGNFTIEDVLKDDSMGMSNKNQLKKYGVKLCGEAWKKNTESWNDDDWFRWDSKNKEAAGFFNRSETVDCRGMEYIHD